MILRSETARMDRPTMATPRGDAFGWRDTASLRRLAGVANPRPRIGWVLGPAAVLLLLGLVVGAVLALLPAPDGPTDAPQTRAVHQRSHRVVEGDSLRDLAGRYYQDPSRWKEIFLANREKLVGKKRLVPGDVLVIPIFDVDREGATGGY